VQEFLQKNLNIDDLLLIGIALFYNEYKMSRINNSIEGNESLNQTLEYLLKIENLDSFSLMQVGLNDGTILLDMVKRYNLKSYYAYNRDSQLMVSLQLRVVLLELLDSQLVEANILNAEKIDKNQNITDLEPKKDPFKTVKIFDTEEIELEKFTVNAPQIKEGNLFCEVLNGIYNEIDKLEKVNFGKEIDFEQGINFNIVSTEYSLKENLKMDYKKRFGIKELIDSLDDKVENMLNFEIEKKREKDSHNIKEFYEFLKKIFDTFKNRDNNISLIRIGKYTGFNDKTINLVTENPDEKSRTIFDENNCPMGWALIKVEEVNI